MIPNSESYVLLMIVNKQGIPRFQSGQKKPCGLILSQRFFIAIMIMYVVSFWTRKASWRGRVLHSIFMLTQSMRLY